MPIVLFIFLFVWMDGSFVASLIAAATDATIPGSLSLSLTALDGDADAVTVALVMRGMP